MSLSCRSCLQGPLKPIASLGKIPLANALVSASTLDMAEPAYPLDLVFCSACGLVQITETVPPERLFREYLYFSSFSDTMLEHAHRLVERLVIERGLDGRSLVIELASNDGYLLQYFVERRIPVLGVEPALNVAAAARSKGVPTISDFFGEETAWQMLGRGVRADVVIANNVLAHVSDLNGFVEGIRILLKPRGLAVIEVPYVKDMIDRCEFDTIYHEHLCYFSVTALHRLLERHGLSLTDVERLPLHGGSLRLFVAHAGNAPRPSVAGVLSDERTAGVDGIDFYQTFAGRMETLKTTLCVLLHELRHRGHKIAAYGAAAKGAVLLNYCGIGPELVDFVVDRNPHK
ncbi:MAG: methyltransferase domain-containing protein, partial [Chloroflexi bacterium]|nr:methyltransferase domain-containing protein [Chloroflexota bacterium]